MILEKLNNNWWTTLLLVIVSNKGELGMGIFTAVSIMFFVFLKETPDKNVGTDQTPIV